MNWNAFSDHAALQFSFLRKSDNINKGPTENKTIFHQKIVFNESMVPNYKELLQQNIHTFDLNYNSTSSVSNKIEILTNYLHENALKIFGKNAPNNSKNTSGNMFNDRPKWFDENCYKAKKDFKNSRNIFNKNKTAENRTSFVKMRTKYNRIRQ